MIDEESKGQPSPQIQPPNDGAYKMSVKEVALKQEPVQYELSPLPQQQQQPQPLPFKEQPLKEEPLQQGLIGVHLGPGRKKRLKKKRGRHARKRADVSNEKSHPRAVQPPDRAVALPCKYTLFVLV
ncbi:protein FAM170B-like [Oreochromis aureus]|uniref:protein FAM170B-like n=1 Tax=Oreochromis aureus TaxID=47969 RepID=UPI001954B38B|nr:protein FAM170B-like [Oreochromis aureus]